MNTKILQIQKRASYIYQNIQDKACSNDANRIFALADGTTQGFNSEKWADIITECFVKSPTFKPKQIIKLFENCAYKFTRETFTYNSNPAIASLEKVKRAKGASATFLGLQFLQDNSVNVISCGDTNLFIVDDEGCFIKCFPFSTLEDLNENANFLNTVELKEKKVDASYFQVTTLKNYKNVVFIMATDALSRLFLRKTETIEEIMQIKNFEMLHCFCQKYWDNKEMEEDDISAIIIKYDSNNITEYIIPPEGFSFPKDKEPIFTPTTLINNTEQIFTDMQMQEIYHQFSGVVNDFREVKRNQKIMQILLIAAIALSFLNLVCFASYMAFGYYEKKNQLKTECFEDKQKEVEPNTLLLNENE